MSKNLINHLEFFRSENKIQAKFIENYKSNMNKEHLETQHCTLFEEILKAKKTIEFLENQNLDLQKIIKENAICSINNLEVNINNTLKARIKKVQYKNFLKSLENNLEKNEDKKNSEITQQKNIDEAKKVSILMNLV